MKRLLPWAVVVIFLTSLAGAAVASWRSADGFDFAAFGRLPVALNGRVQPIDSVARLGLLQITGTVTVPREDRAGWRRWTGEGTLAATEWIAEVLMKPDAADARRIFRIGDPKLLGQLHITAARSRAIDYSFTDLAPALEEIGRQTARIAGIQPAARAPWERQVIRLRNAIVIYERLKNSLQPNTFLQGQRRRPVEYDFAGQLAVYTADLRGGVAVSLAREHGRPQQLDASTVDRMRAFTRPYVGVARSALLAVVPPLTPEGASSEWQNIGTAIVGSARNAQLPMPVAYYAAMSAAVANGNAAAFNDGVRKYEQWLAQRGLTPQMRAARAEYFVNGFQPFARAVAVYLTALFLMALAWRSASATLRRTAGLLVILAAVLHSAGLVFEVMTAGRPPVTNTYVALLFAGWALVTMAGVYEVFRRNGIGLTAAAVAGATTLAAAHSFVMGGTLLLLRTAFDISLWAAMAATLVLLAVAALADRPAPTSAIMARRKWLPRLPGRDVVRVSVTPR